MKTIAIILLITLIGLNRAVSQNALTAEFFNKKIKLTWQAANEENLNYYAIERSSNGRRYETVAMVKPDGSNFYRWYEKDWYQGTVYYRLKAISHSRSFEIKGAVIAFQIKEGQKEISIFPDLKNPASVYVDASVLGDNEVSIEITDSEGFVMTNCRPADFAQYACPLVLGSLQKVNCTINAVLPGKMIRSRLNIYDASLNFSDSSTGDSSNQAFLIR